MVVVGWGEKGPSSVNRHGNSAAVQRQQHEENSTPADVTTSLSRHLGDEVLGIQKGRFLKYLRALSFLFFLCRNITHPP
jgi:hypothetical protein